MPPHPPSLVCLGKSDIYVNPLLQILAMSLKSETACADHKLVESEIVVSSDLLTHSCGHDFTSRSDISHRIVDTYYMQEQLYGKVAKGAVVCNIYS